MNTPTKRRVVESSAITTLLQRSEVAQKVSDLTTIGASAMPLIVDLSAKSARIKAVPFDAKVAKIRLGSELTALCSRVLAEQVEYKRIIAAPLLRTNLVMPCDFGIAPVYRVSKETGVKTPDIETKANTTYIASPPLQLVCENEDISIATPSEVEYDLRFTMKTMPTLTARDHLERTGILSSTEVGEFIVVKVAENTVVFVGTHIGTQPDKVKGGTAGYISLYQNKVAVGAGYQHMMNITIEGEFGVTPPPISDLFPIGSVFNLPLHTMF